MEAAAACGAESEGQEGMADRSDEARQRAEYNFKKKSDRPRKARRRGRSTSLPAKAADVNRAKLKALRLAKEGEAEVTKKVRKRAAKPST